MPASSLARIGPARTRKPVEQVDGLGEARILIWLDNGVDGFGRPGLARRCHRPDRLASFVGGGEKDLAPVGRVRRAVHETVAFQRGDDLGDRLRTDVLGSGQSAGGDGACSMIRAKVESCETRPARRAG